MTLNPVYLEHHLRDATGTGVYEPEFMGMPLAKRGSSVKPPPCIIAHGAGVRGSGQLETYGSASPGVSQLMQEMSQYFTVVMPLLGGDQWGNATHVARIENARLYLASIGSTGPVTLVCYSMGHTGMANYAVTYPASTRCLIAIEGVQDIANMKSRFPGAAPNFGNDIDAAYPGGSAVYIPRSPYYPSLAGNLGYGNVSLGVSALQIPTLELFTYNDSVIDQATTRLFLANYLNDVMSSSAFNAIWPSGNNGAGQFYNYGKLWWKDIGAWDHTDLAILAGSGPAIQFARYLTL